MKKIIYLISAVAAIASFASCQKDIDNAPAGEKVAVTLDVTAPGDVSTKAIADGLTATDLYYEVYGDDITADPLYVEGPIKLENRKTSITLYLVKDQTYNLAFFAVNPKAKENKIYSWGKLSDITIDYTTTVSAANDETRDAFYGKLTDLTVTGPIKEDVTLRRPFAQVNFGTTEQDIDDAFKIGKMAPKVSKLTVSLTPATKFNPFGFNPTDGQTSNTEVEFEFDYAAIPDPAADKDGLLYVDLNGDEDTSDEGEQFRYLSMNYLFFNQDDNVTVTANVTMENGQKDVVIKAENVPVKANYRTNILGNLLTAPGVFNIVIDQTFVDDHNTDEIVRNVFANGGTVTLHEDMTIDKTLVVAKGVNAVLNLNGKTITNKENNELTDVIVVEEGATLEINGPGLVQAVSGNDGYAVIAKGVLTINGGTFMSGLDKEGKQNAVIYSRHEDAKIYITGGEFRCAEATDATLNEEYRDYRFTINKWGDAENALIEVTGGKFYNFNPNDNKADGPNTDYVPDGYVVEESTDAEGNTIYVVKKDK